MKGPDRAPSSFKLRPPLAWFYSATAAWNWSALYTRDRRTDECGLGSYQSARYPDEDYAEHTGMPVEVVRAYARAHGGVAVAGEEAVALLKRLPAAADILPLDELTPVVLEAKETLARFDAGFLWKGKPAVLPADELEAWHERASVGYRVSKHLGTLMAYDRFARHPLLEEARALRERLLSVGDEAHVELPRAHRRAKGIRFEPTPSRTERQP